MKLPSPPRGVAAFAVSASMILEPPNNRGNSVGLLLGLYPTVRFSSKLFGFRPFTTSTSGSTSAFRSNDRQIFHFIIFDFLRYKNS
jgi:hypothetical protein